MDRMASVPLIEFYWEWTELLYVLCLAQCLTESTLHNYDLLCIAGSTIDIAIAAMRCLVMGIPSEKWVIRQFWGGVNITECTYMKLEGKAYCLPKLYVIAHCF